MDHHAAFKEGHKARGFVNTARRTRLHVARNFEPDPVVQEKAFTSSASTHLTVLSDKFMGAKVPPTHFHDRVYGGGTGEACFFTAELLCFSDSVHLDVESRFSREFSGALDTQLILGRCRH